METMQALQEMVDASRVDQERIQIDLPASLVRNEELQRANEELRRDLRNQVGVLEVEDQEPTTPPKDFPMPFSQAIIDIVIPAMFVGPNIRGAQSHFHRGGGPKGSPHDLSYADDAGWGV